MILLRHGWIADYLSSGTPPNAANCQLIKILSDATRDTGATVRLSDGLHYISARLTLDSLRLCAVPVQLLLGGILTLVEYGFDLEANGEQFILVVDKFQDRGGEGACTWKDPVNVHSSREVAAQVALRQQALPEAIQVVLQEEQRHPEYPEDAPEPFLYQPLNTQQWGSPLSPSLVTMPTPDNSLSMSLGSLGDDVDEEDEDLDVVGSGAMSNSDLGEDLAAASPRVLASPPAPKRRKSVILEDDEDEEDGDVIVFVAPKPPSPVGLPGWDEYQVKAFRNALLECGDDWVQVGRRVAGRSAAQCQKLYEEHKDTLKFEIPSPQKKTPPPKRKISAFAMARLARKNQRQ